jgi:dihydroflavonol-4-reductase
MIFVTGGTGLVGTYLLHELCLQGSKIRALIRPGHSKQFVSSLFNCFASLPESASLIEWVEGDILDIYSLDKAMQGVTRVYHCAGQVSFRPEERMLMHKINVEGTANVVNSCIKQNVKKLVHVSSISAFGNHSEIDIIDENTTWQNSWKPSAYAISKYTGELEVWRGIAEGLNAVIVNPSVIIGAASHPKAVNPILAPISKLLPYYTCGVTGYVDVRDVAKAMILLMESEINGERFILNAENLTQRELFNHCAMILQKKGPKIYLSKSILKFASYLEILRNLATGSQPSITPENVRSVTGINRYSAEKFKLKFDYTFIPIDESLSYAFQKLKTIQLNPDLSRD